ncbi:MAG: hypothetical protein ACLFVP_01640 [Candidatus Bathyarchaeia archaeon]
MVDEETLLNRIKRIIAATRFPFIDQEDWPEDYETIVNDETRRFGIKWRGGICYPSIVILRGDGEVQELGEVEPVGGVSEESVNKWRLLSDTAGIGRRVKKFFLYVPEGVEDDALSLLEENDIEYDGLRTYAVREGKLVVTPIMTHDHEKDHR